MFKNLLFLFLLSQILFAQNVQIHGALKKIMHGNLDAHFNLQELQDKRNIYGLGALEDLKGEIIIIDSKPYVSFVKEHKVVIDSTFNYNSALFAFSNVEQWETDTIYSAFGFDELEKLFAQKINKNMQPLTFLIEGQVKSLKWHVIDWADGDTVHTHHKHKMAGLHGELKNEQVTIVGFYSKHHKGLLTHRDSSLHLHFVDEKRKLSGHVDTLILKNGILKIAL